MKSISDRIMRRVRAHVSHGTRQAFTPGDFLDFGDRAGVDQALSRLHRTGALRRVTRGVYDLPRVNPLIGRSTAPDIPAVVDAVARRRAHSIVPDGLTSANRLGLTNAVPARNHYLTDGSTRTMTVGKNKVRLKHAAPRLLALKGRPAGDLVRALDWIGDSASDDQVVSTLRKRLSPDARNDLAKARKQLSGRAAAIADRVLQGA